MNELTRRLSAGGGMLARRDHPDLIGSIGRALRTGRLVHVLPGVYCPPAAAGDWRLLAHAALLWAGPDAVLTGLTAARLTFWPAAPSSAVVLASPTGRRGSGSVRVERRQVPPELVLRRGVLVATTPCATAVDLAATPHGGAAVDEALRTRTATLAQMWEALARQPDRPGNARRRMLLHDSRDEPWSEAERDLHRLLRAAGITGWETNAEVAGYQVDVWFRRQRLALEVDGWAVHGSRQAFEDDRVRRNALVLAGCTVLNFTWRQLQDHPERVVDTVRAALAGACG